MENRKKKCYILKAQLYSRKFLFLFFILFIIWILTVFTDVDPNDFKAMNPIIIVKSEQRFIIRT